MSTGSTRSSARRSSSTPGHASAARSWTTSAARTGRRARCAASAGRWRRPETLYAKNGTAPSDEEVSAVLGVDTSELRVAREELGRAELVSLNAPVRSAGDAVPGEVGDLVEAAPGSHDPERTFLSRERAQHVRAAIEALDEREREIFTLVYVQKLSGAEIGEMFGVTESRVSQILGGVRRKLREHLDRYETSVAAA